MTFSHVLLILGAAISFGAGWYGHYKFGSKLASIEAKVRSVV